MVYCSMTPMIYSHMTSVVPSTMPLVIFPIMILVVVFFIDSGDFIMLFVFGFFILTSCIFNKNVDVKYSAHDAFLE